MVSTNIEIRNAPINGPIKERIMSMSNFLIKALQDSFEEDNFMYVAGAGKMEA
jgi:hypothetical protein